MGRRHDDTARPTTGRGLALAAALAAGAVAASIAFLSLPAGADTAATTATFSVTGVATSNCPVSVGGSDVYVAPGAELDLETSAVGVTTFGLPISTSGILGFDGTLVIDSNTTRPYALKTTTITTISGLSAGDHSFTWTAAAVSPLGLSIPLGLDSAAVKAGAALTYTGTIHVTSAAAQCGIAVQLPGPVASASVSGLATAKVSVAPVHVAVPVSLPSLSPPSSPPSSGAAPTSSGARGSAASTGGDYVVPGLSLPQPVASVAGGAGAGAGAGGAFAGAQGDEAGTDGGPAADSGVGTVPSGAAPTAAKIKISGVAAPSTQTAVDVASKQSPIDELPVLLGIAAIIALALVTATYARMYLLRKRV